MLVTQSCLTLCHLMNCVACQTPLSLEFSRQEYWSGCYFLLQGIFPIQGLNQGLLCCKQILYCLSHQGSPLYEHFCCSVAQSHLTLCNPIDCSMPGFPVHHQLLDLAQTHVMEFGCDAIQPSHPLSSPSPPAFSLSRQ